MAGLLDGILNGLTGSAATGDLGHLPQDEWKRAALEDLLSRLAGQTAEQAKADPPGKSPVIAGPMMGTSPGQWQTTMTTGATPVPERAPVGQAYTAPEASIVPDDFARRAAAASATAAPRPTAPARAPSLDGPSTKQKFMDAFAALSGGQVPDRERELEQKNATFAYMLSKGIPEADARNVIMSGNANLMNAVLGGKTAPQIVKVPGPYGAELDMYWDASSGKLQPLTNLMAPGAATSAPKMGDLPAPAGAMPSAPAMGTPAPSASGGPSVTVPPQSAPMPLGTQSPADAPKPAAVAPAPSNDFVVGNAVPKVPEGYVHRLSPDGKGYLYSRDGKPVFEPKATVEKAAENRAKSNEEDRNKAMAAIETARKVQDVYGLLDKRLPFADESQTAFTDKFGNRYATYGDVVGPWAKPEVAGGNSMAGQVIAGFTSLPSYAMQTARNIAAQRSPDVAATRQASNELDTALTALQSSRVKELFGSSNLSDADREAAARTVGTLTAQNATALKGQLSVGEKDSYTRIAKALDDGLITPNDVPQELMQRGIKLGLLKPDLVFKRGR